MVLVFPYLLFLEHNHFFSCARKLALFSRTIVAPCHCTHLSLSILCIFLHDFNIIKTFALTHPVPSALKVSPSLFRNIYTLTFHVTTFLFFSTKIRKGRFRKNKFSLLVSNITQSKLNK
jgi:hypothetical protein